MSLVISIAGMMILARLLTPTQIGTYSVAAAFIGIAHVLRDFGVGSYLVQESDLTPQRIRAAISIMTLSAWSIAVVLLVSSSHFAAFYSEPLLQPIILVLCINFFLLPFNAPVLSLLRRDMNFAALFKINLISNLAHPITAVTLAWQGHGIMSLAWAPVASLLASLIMTSFYRPSWRLWIPTFTEFGRVASFGLKASAAGVVSVLGTSAYDLILGRMIGFAPLAQFSRAQGLMFLFHRDVMSTVRGVMFPAMAIKKRAGDDLTAFYLRAITNVSGIAWPFYTLLALMAFPVVRIMFGDQWDTAVPLVRILALAGTIGTTFSLSSSLLMARGNVGTILYLELIIQVSRIGLLIPAALHSLEAVAWSVCATYFIAGIANNWVLRRYIGLRFFDLCKALIPSALITGCSSVAPILVVVFFDVQNTDTMFRSTLLAVAGAGFGWLLGVYITNHPILNELKILQRKFAPRAIFLRLGAKN